MALAPGGTTLFIADRENHVVRLADLEDRTVETLAGTGSQAFAYPTGGPALQTPLSSPWDVELVGDHLLLAMAGVHQLWRLDLIAQTVEVFAGNGGEGLDDGPRLETTLSQPSGFATDQETLYFTDPESSAVRRLPIDGQGPLETIIGTGLFDWGDVERDLPRRAAAARHRHRVPRGRAHCGRHLQPQAEAHRSGDAELVHLGGGGEAWPSRWCW